MSSCRLGDASVAMSITLSLINETFRVSGRATYDLYAFYKKKRRLKKATASFVRMYTGHEKHGHLHIIFLYTSVLLIYT